MCPDQALSAAPGAGGQEMPENELKRSPRAASLGRAAELDEFNRAAPQIALLTCDYLRAVYVVKDCGPWGSGN